MRVLGIVFALTVIVILVGYADAYNERQVNTTVYASVIHPWSLYNDTFPDFMPFENGQLFVQVHWAQPSPDTRVSSIRIKGVVEENGQRLSTFDGPCRRAGSTWLAKAHWSFGTLTNTDLTCFIKLDMIVRMPEGKEPNYDEAKELIANMKVRYSAEIKAANAPMRYVTWINQIVRNVWAFVRQPFQRT